MRHYQRMLDLAIEALREPDPGRLWPPVVSELLNACGGEFLFLTRAERTGGGGPVRSWAADGAAGHRLDDHLRERIRLSCPFADHYAASGDRAPRTAADILGEREWHDSETARLLRNRLGTDHLLVLPLPETSGPRRCFLICRSGADFTDAHLAYARRIQPLLASVDEQAELLSRWRAAAASEERAAASAAEDRTAPQGADEPVPGGDLTPRELTVLGLLADALTAAVIGRRLGISVHTVQKHIQSIYRKLGTRDRVTTVLRAQTYGLIPAPAGAPEAGGTAGAGAAGRHRIDRA
ncbi:helix-turn-helix transcriptional regulator [Streptomyces flavofungini]|uniref:helix-turn-helix transcriptional regulator n=1 Tax=Streptomyces flavofungini TaxID=68200 RepID=UPI0025B0BA60|nr:LuxR C-terminal-related transcriptional regulator [Streptomyces flavofungini]WJV45321.1 LuxR C-terminal-related transcriptional regulator [Streptomyces flavofungini]